MAASKRLRKYELIYLLQPEASDEVKDRIYTRVVDTISAGEGLIYRREMWGKRKLAYEIRKYNKAFYYYIIFAAYPGLTHEIERNLRLTDDCIRFMTVKLEDDIPLEVALAEVEQQKSVGVFQVPEVFSPDDDADADDDDDLHLDDADDDDDVADSLDDEPGGDEGPPWGGPRGGRSDA